MLDENRDNIPSENLAENPASNSSPESNTPEKTEEPVSEIPSTDEVVSEAVADAEEVPVATEDITEAEATEAEGDNTIEETVAETEEPIKETEEPAKETEEKIAEKKEVPTAAEANEETVVKDTEGIEDTEKVAESNNDAELTELTEKETIENESADEKPAPDEKEAEEKVVAAESQEKKEVAKEVIKKIDYNSLDLEQLVNELEKLIKHDDIPVLKEAVESIKLCFNQRYGALLKEKKEAFMADGGNEIDFQYSSPIKSKYNDLLFEFKVKRQRYYKQLEDEQKENLAKRIALIEELKDLINNAEPSTMYNQFRDLQQRWRAVGKIPRAKYNDIWRTYHHHVERFYDLLHLSNDFRDLDFKHNLEEKLKLVEKAEALAESDDLNKAFKELQVLHKLWKEDIGPVAREYREDIWERFSKATKKIHEQRHELQKELESKYEENVILKRELIAKINNLVDGALNSHKLWQQKIRELEAIRKEFFSIGRVPRALNEKIWTEFKDATRAFNREKNNFYKSIKRGQHENLAKKNALVEKAEALKDSEDWDTTTEIMKQIQAEWKTIGHVPRKYSDKIWNRFKAACNHYFDRLHGVQDEANKEQVEAFTKKKELLENLKSQADKGEPLTLEVINSYIDDWRALGSLPSNMRHLETKFNKTLQNLYAKLDLDEKEIALLKFKNTINTYISQRNFRKVDNEQLFVRKKIDEVTREIQQLENNISFISNADDDNPLLKNVRSNIENYREQLAIWKAKLEYVTGLDY